MSPPSAVADDGQVAVAAGDYQERLFLSRPVRLVGRCPELVTLRGRRIVSTDYPPVQVTAGGTGSTLRGTALRGDAEELTVDEAALTAEAVQIRDNVETGISIFSEPTSISDFLIMATAGEQQTATAKASSPSAIPTAVPAVGSTSPPQ